MRCGEPGSDSASESGGSSKSPPRPASSSSPPPRPARRRRNPAWCIVYLFAAPPVLADSSSIQGTSAAPWRSTRRAVFRWPDEGVGAPRIPGGHRLIARDRINRCWRARPIIFASIVLSIKPLGALWFTDSSKNCSMARRARPIIARRSVRGVSSERFTLCARAQSRQSFFRCSCLATRATKQVSPHARHRAAANTGQWKMHIHTTRRGGTTPASDPAARAPRRRSRARVPHHTSPAPSPSSGSSSAFA